MVAWFRFEWDLEGLSPGEGTAAPFVLRRAQQSEENVVRQVVDSALSMDAGAGDFRKYIEETAHPGLTAAFAREEAACEVLLHGSRIVGASVLDPSEDAENHLLTGPCVLYEYRSRGLGSHLLLASLRALRAAGLSRAHGLARERSALGRFVYPKFGGVAIAYRPVFLPEPRRAA